MDNDEKELENTYENEKRFETLQKSNGNLNLSDNLKRRTNVGPWKNVEEFKMVYMWLFGGKASYETKTKACRKMAVWKLRSLNLTPASVLSTLAIVDVQLKDDLIKSVTELQVLYSGAFTRFLNYMCSTGQKGKMKTMYQIAMEIGIDPFIVDLRHLCAHGQTMPSINVLKRASDYCLNWLKEFYWDHEYENQKNVDSKNVRRDDITTFDEQVSELFDIYDVSLLAVYKNCMKVNEARKYLSNENYNMLKKYSNINKIIQLDRLQNNIITHLENLVRQETSVKNFASIFITAFTKMVFLFEIPGNPLNSNKNLRNFVRANRKLFRSIAMHGFIEKLFDELMYISENNFEVMLKKNGASFWANEIVLGFIAFNKFKIYCKSRKENDPSFHITKKNINNIKGLSKEIKKIYSELDIDADSMIIFGDHYKRPWSLSFSRSYIEERLKNVNNFTKNIVENCLLLVYPPLSDVEKNKLLELVNIYCDSITAVKDNLEEKNSSECGNICYTKEDFDAVNNILDIEMKGETDLGIWFEADDGFEWHLCPLGRLPWE